MSLTRDDGGLKIARADNSHSGFRFGIAFACELHERSANPGGIGDNHESRHATRRIQLEHHLLDYQFGLPPMWWQHDGIPMLRQVPQKLARGMGVG
jgi:hypothetical protein